MNYLCYNNLYKILVKKCKLYTICFMVVFYNLSCGGGSSDGGKASTSSSEGADFFPIEKREPLFLPDGEKDILIIGQDLVALGNSVDNGTVYSGGYLDDAELSELPLGATTYLSVVNSDGLTGTVNHQGEIKNADLTIKNTAFSNTVPILVIGYYLDNNYSEILNGNRDQYIQNLADWIKESNIPVFLRIGYEFNASWTGHSLHKQDFIKSFRYIASKIQSYGAFNCAFVWQTDGYGTLEEIASMYPGDEYVDWMAYSHFYSNAGDSLIQMATIHNKPVMIAEAAPVDFNLANSDEGKIAWEEWFLPLFNKLESEPRIRMLAYINDNWPQKEMWATSDVFKNTDSRVQINSYVRERWIFKIKNGSWYSRGEILSAISWPIE